MVDRQQTVGHGINVCLCVLCVSAVKIGCGSITAETRRSPEALVMVYADRRSNQ